MSGLKEETTMKPLLHVAMFPWFAFGHMTSFLNLSNELADRGHKVSFLLPNKALSQLRHHNLHPHLITFYTISVPHVPGLPVGTETAYDIPVSLCPILATAMDMTRPHVETLLRGLGPDLVFYDFAPWIPDIGFKSVCYSTVSAASLAIALVPALNRPEEEGALLEPPPGYPSKKVVLRKHEARDLSSFMFMEYGGGMTFYGRITTAIAKADAVAIRTCRELEGEFCDYMESQYGKPMLLTGPVLPKPTNSPLEAQWATFFDSFEPQSVIYCALGSEWKLEKDQFQELVLGIEMTKMPFYVAVKPPIGCNTIEEALPDGFRERVEGRGVVFGGWVPQVQILNHGSVGCFVSHCGFGSMWEGLRSSCQRVLMPNISEQILNARILADELHVAVEVMREPNGLYSRDNLCETIESVMGKEPKIVELLRQNHLKLKETLLREEFISSYLDKFVQKLHHI